ncbi:MAG: transcriptional repressor NrdR [Dehalococcoidia bacterium]|nr:transcriptional repressor NrdR [Dehalococcoidia bacterium]
MRCPYCGHNDSKVIDSRDVNEAVRRRRECLGCGSRFTTYERPQATALLVIKKDGRREEFSREKLIAGIRKACAKRPVSQETIEQTVDDIEAQLHKLGKGEVATSIIGDMVIERLRQLDGIAYIRFASVYRAFADIEEVREEADAYTRLKLLRNSTNQLPLFPNEELDTMCRGVAKRAASNYRREEDEQKKRISVSPSQ